MIILRQKEYARKDYLGLSMRQADILKNKRSQIAKNLIERRNNINSTYNKELEGIKSLNSDLISNKGYDNKQINKIIGGKKNQAIEKRNYLINSSLTGAENMNSLAKRIAWDKSVMDRAKNIKSIRKNKDISKRGYLNDYNYLGEIDRLGVYGV